MDSKIVRTFGIDTGGVNGPNMTSKYLSVGQNLTNPKDNLPTIHMEDEAFQAVQTVFRMRWLRMFSLALTAAYVALLLGTVPNRLFAVSTNVATLITVAFVTVMFGLGFATWFWAKRPNWFAVILTVFFVAGSVFYLTTSPTTKSSISNLQTYITFYAIPIPALLIAYWLANTAFYRLATWLVIIGSLAFLGVRCYEFSVNSYYLLGFVLIVVGAVLLMRVWEAIVVACACTVVLILVSSLAPPVTVPNTPDCHDCMG